MNTNNKWNPHMNKDSIAFSALLITGLVMTWFAAATSMTDPDAALARHGASASDSRSVVTASRLKAVAPSPSSTPTAKIL